MEFKGTKVEQIAQQVLLKCKFNMNGYLDRLERIQDDLKSVASDVEGQIDITPYFEQFVRNFQASDMQRKIAALKELKNNVFRHTLNQTYLRAFDVRWGVLKAKVHHLDILPIYKEDKLDEWLEQMGLWLQNVKISRKMEADIHDDINYMMRILAAINNLNDYEYAFTNFYELSLVLADLLL